MKFQNERMGFSFVVYVGLSVTDILMVAVSLVRSPGGPE